MATPKKTDEELKLTYGNSGQRFGKPSAYDPKHVDTVYTYIEDCRNNGTFPTVAELSLILHVAKNTIYEWANKHPDFQDGLTALHAEQEKLLINNTLNKVYSDRFAQFFMINRLGYNNKVTAEITTNTVENMIKEADGDKF